MIRYVTPDYITGVQALYPSADYLRDIIFADTQDGNGPFLSQWNVPNTVPPTDLEAQTAVTNKVSSLDSIQFRILFNHENRIRTLEARQPITVKQFLNAITNLPNT